MEIILKCFNYENIPFLLEGNKENLSDNDYSDFNEFLNYSDIVFINNPFNINDKNDSEIRKCLNITSEQVSCKIPINHRLYRVHYFLIQNNNLPNGVSNFYIRWVYFGILKIGQEPNEIVLI